MQIIYLTIDWKLEVEAESHSINVFYTLMNCKNLKRYIVVLFASHDTIHTFHTMHVIEWLGGETEEKRGRLMSYCYPRLFLTAYLRATY